MALCLSKTLKYLSRRELYFPNSSFDDGSPFLSAFTVPFFKDPTVDLPQKLRLAHELH
jgi:hypothetical protein